MSTLSDLLQQIQVQVNDLETTNTTLISENSSLASQLAALSSAAISEIVEAIDSRLENLENLVGVSPKLDSVKTSWVALKNSI